ncbi:Lactocepin [Flagellimonas maritima]|uniref:Lactocepin n=1 Tax=Flagellimonas maritima TaxID=1383885 RepID=A0A2Z4LSP6_9FLAO|nr:Lactocepin [Allomuricauda aurantiaca]
MKRINYLGMLSMALCLMVWACGKDDAPTTTPEPEPEPIAAPTISDFSPISGPVGTAVTIEGTNFSTTAANNTVTFGTVAATVASATATKIVASVPSGAATGKVGVAVGGKTAASTKDFTVTVTEEEKNPSIGLDKEDFQLFRYDTAELAVVDKVDVDGDSPVAWSSDDEEIATVDENGTVKGLKVGTATITATVEEASASVTVTVDPNVYMAGYVQSSGLPQAVIWKNGVMTELTDGTKEATANAVFVYGEDVYVAGHEKDQDNNRRAMLWINGDQIALSNSLGITSSIARDVVVNESGYYVVGHQSTNEGSSGRVWISNANDVVLVEPGYETNFPRAISMDDQNNWYVSGYIRPDAGFDDEACYWTAGTAANPEILENDARAYDIQVVGNDVHVSGYRVVDGTRVATTWKNGAGTDLTDGTSNSIATSLFVTGTDIYATGNDSDNSLVWKNGVVGTLLNIDDSTSFLESVFVYGTDVYSCGAVSQNLQKAILWKNGEPTIFFPEDFSESSAFSVFVD